MKRARAKPSSHPARAAFAARAMRKPLRAMQREIAGVRLNEDIECVHRMRVASRRLRNALGLFEGELPPAARGPWRKRFKEVTKSLGAARDLDVQIAFLRQYLESLSAGQARVRPGIEHVLALLAARRAAAQTEVLRALDRLEASRALAGLARWVAARRAAGDPRRPAAAALRAEAARAVRHRLGDLFAYEPYVERAAAVAELHAMRIAAKRLRYTLEVYGPLYADGLAMQIQWTRQLQDWLGEIHDCDVWHEYLGRLLMKSARRPRRGPRRAAPDRKNAGVRHLRRERDAHRRAIYEEFRSAWRHAAATGTWDEFRRPFVEDLADEPPATKQNGSDGVRAPSLRRGRRSSPAGEPGDDQRLQPVLELARSCRYEIGHTHQVTRLAGRLFDELAGLHGLDDERRFWLVCASLLHDIGWVEGRAGHHKTALRRILESPLLPWDQRLRRIVGSIARYHRKALPSEDHEDFRALTVRDRADVGTLAAILRLADALDYSHGRVVADLTCRVTAQRITIRCRATRSAAVECARTIEKGDLAAQVFDREIRVTWHPR